ncbi:MAG: hypothetical protein AB2A00_13370 [Myxococcota bacterium]
MSGAVLGTNVAARVGSYSAPHAPVSNTPRPASADVDVATVIPAQFDARVSRHERAARTTAGTDHARTGALTGGHAGGSVSHFRDGRDVHRVHADRQARAARSRTDLPEDAVAAQESPRVMTRHDLTDTELAGCRTTSDRLALAAERNVGFDSRSNSPAACREGRGACAWAVNQMMAAGGVDPLMGSRERPGASLALTRSELERRVREGTARRIEVTPETRSLPPGAVICTADGMGRGHIGIVGRDGVGIYSNSSVRGQWEQNYSSPAHWYSQFSTTDVQPSGRNGRGIGPTSAYVLD